MRVLTKAVDQVNSAYEAERYESYAYGISAIATVLGYCGTYMAAAVEILDRELGANVVPDHKAILAGAASFMLGTTGATILTRLNRRQ